MMRKRKKGERTKWRKMKNWAICSVVGGGNSVVFLLYPRFYQLEPKHLTVPRRREGNYFCHTIRLLLFHVGWDMCQKVYYTY